MKGKIALVTGATRGIGKAIALELLSRGATVIGTATSEKGAETIKEYLSANGTGLVLNVTSRESITECLKFITTTYGDIDILVNNAGITRDNLLMRMNDEEWNSILDTNLTPIYLLSKAVMRSMQKKRFGRIINIGSIVGVTGNMGQANYAAAKAAVIGFSKSMALEVATRGITVNVIAPGFIATDMTSVLKEDVKTAILAKVPMGILGQAEDIAKTAAFLASDDAKYITGQTIHVNGGMLMP